MIKTFLIIILFFLPLVNSPSSPFLGSSYCVLDSVTGDFLEGKNIHLKRSVASISKVMTAILALEYGNLYSLIEVDDVIDTIEGSSLYLEKGTKITLLDLVYGLLLRSGNDAGVLICKNVFSTSQKFIQMMNDKAKELGMNDTIFVNPTGLDIYDNGNISSSYDMALLFSYCMENDLFKKITSSLEYKNELKGRWKNKNKLLFNYKYCIGGKTGFTKKAKRTLLTKAKKGNKEIVICSLNLGNDFSFHKEIYEKYFNKYNYIIYLKKGINYIGNYIIESKKYISSYILNIYFPKIIKYEIDKNNDLINIFLLDEERNIIFNKKENIKIM